MKLRTVVTLARANERATRRRFDPRGLRYHLFVLLRLVRDLDEREGRRTSHVASALLALLLTGLGVTGAGPGSASRPLSAGAAASGVLDRIHTAERGQPRPGDTRRPAPSPGQPRPTTVLAYGSPPTFLPDRGAL
jgi:hypothetical protein